MREMTYQLNRNEIQEAWRSANWKKEVFQKINQKILLVLSLLFAVGYCLEPRKLYLILDIGIITLFLFYYSYFQIWLQRKRAEKMEKRKGIYKIKVGKFGIYAGENMNFYDLRNEKWEFLESERVYTLKIGREIFCIPKRTVSWEEEGLKQLRMIGRCAFHKVITERRN